jgi:hypothetical protein
MVFRTASLWLALDDEASQRLAVQKTMKRKKSA